MLAFVKKLRRQNNCLLMHSLTIKCNPLVDTLNVMSSVCFSCRKSLTRIPPTGIVTCWIGGALHPSNVLGVMSATADVCPANHKRCSGCRHCVGYASV